MPSGTAGTAAAQRGVSWTGRRARMPCSITKNEARLWPSLGLFSGMSRHFCFETFLDGGFLKKNINSQKSASGALDIR